jgi:hypothetical protein
MYGVATNEVVCSQAHWPGYLTENRYPPDEVITRLHLVHRICPRPNMHVLGIIVRAYAYNHGELAAHEHCARRRMRDDFRDYKNFGVLPEYVICAEEKLLARGFRLEPRGAAAGP